MPLDDALTIWYRGPVAVGARDPYAGILTSRHGSYLLGGRLARGVDPPDGKESITRYIEDMETLRDRMAARLLRREPHAGAALLDGVGHAYRLLQITDDLSLRFCTGPLREGVIERAPRAGIEETQTLYVRPADDRTLTLHPWPFDTPEILLLLPYIDLPDERLESDRDLKRRMAAAERRITAFRLLDATAAPV